MTHDLHSSRFLVDAFFCLLSKTFRNSTPKNPIIKHQTSKKKRRAGRDRIVCVAIWSSLDTCSSDSSYPPRLLEAWFVPWFVLGKFLLYQFYPLDFFGFGFLEVWNYKRKKHQNSEERERERESDGHIKITTLWYPSSRMRVITDDWFQYDSWMSSGRLWTFWNGEVHMRRTRTVRAGGWSARGSATGMSWISVVVRGEKASLDFTISLFLDNAFNKFNKDSKKQQNYRNPSYWAFLQNSISLEFWRNTERDIVIWQMGCAFCIFYYPTGRFGGCVLDITLSHLSHDFWTSGVFTNQRSRNMPSSVPVSSCWPLAGFSVDPIQR